MKNIPSWAIIIVSIVAMAPPAESSEWWVASAGDDANPGTVHRPFATLERARDRVREQVARGLDEDVVIWIRAGTYRLEKPLVFGPADSGTAAHSITYAAAPAETVTISGGRVISGWKAGAHNRWTAALPAVARGAWFFRQLYVDDERVPRGRFPETGFLILGGHSDDSRELRFSEPLPAVEFGGGDTEVVVVQNWSIAREIIEAGNSTSLTTRTPVGWVGHGSCRPKPGMSVFIEHALDFVTRPGQWYLDRTAGVLHYQAADGEDPNTRVFVAPVAEQLVRIEGPVRNLVFRELQFEHTRFDMPEIGYAGIQACYYGTTTEDAETFAVPVAMEWVRAGHCRLEACRFAHLGGSALGLGAGSRSNRVVGCEFFDIGGTGINIGHMPIKSPLWADWADPADAPTGNAVENCYLHHCGVELWGAHGIFDAMTRGTTIAHNELRHLPYGGIAIGYRWGTEPTSQRDTSILSNHVHEVMETLYDSGAIYTLGYQPGSVIRGNHLHGVRRSGIAFGQAGNNGIFLDEGSKGFTLADNVIYDTADAPIRFNRSQEDWQTWTNNSFGIAPGEAGFPDPIANRAGLQPEFQPLLGTP